MSRKSGYIIYIFTCPGNRGRNANLLLPAALNTFHDDSTQQTDTGTPCKSTAPQNYKFTVPAVYVQCPDVQYICPAQWVWDLWLRPPAAGLWWHSKVLCFPKASHLCT